MVAEAGQQKTYLEEGEGGGGGGGTPGGNWEVAAGFGGIGTPTLPGGPALFVGGWLWNGVTIGGGLFAGAVCQGGFNACKINKWIRNKI